MSDHNKVGPRIVGLTRTIALEGARHGITANAIPPASSRPRMLASMNCPARDKLVAEIPLRHPGGPPPTPARTPPDT